MRNHESPAVCKQARRWGLPQLILLANIISIIAVSIFFRVWHLHNIPGLNADEAQYGVKSQLLLMGKAIEQYTNNGNPNNWFYLGPIFLLHVIFPPSIVLLRSFAVFSGLALLLVNFMFCRKVFDQRTAIVSTLLFAVLPGDIIYSRIGWDPCEIVPIDLVVIYLALLSVKERAKSVLLLVLAGIALEIAYFIHPTNVFLAPVLVVAFFSRWRSRVVLAWRRLGTKKQLALVASVAGVAWCVGTIAVKEVMKKPVYAFWFSHPVYGNIPLAIMYYLRLFSGITVMQYVAGSCAFPVRAGIGDLNFWDFVFLLLCLVPVVFFARACRKADHDMDRLLAVFWASIMVLFFAVAGTRALMPELDRYGLCLVPCAVLILSRGMAFAMCQSRLRLPVAAAALLIAWAMLGAFYINIFESIMETGGMREEHFRTGVVEPKVAAVNYLLAHRDRNSQCVVLTSQWWNYQPLLYFTVRDRSITVLQTSELTGAAAGIAGKALALQNLWMVDFVDSPAEIRLIKWIKANHLNCEQVVFPDYAGKPLLSVTRPLPGRPCQTLPF